MRFQRLQYLAVSAVVAVLIVPVVFLTHSSHPHVRVVTTTHTTLTHDLPVASHRTGWEALDVVIRFEHDVAVHQAEVRFETAVAAGRRREAIAALPPKRPVATAIRLGTAIVAPTSVAVIASDGNYPCGGVLYPPCFVAQRESGNQYFRADGSPIINPTGCSGAACFGRWQFGGFWACHWGLPCDIAHWTPAQQDYAARMLWNGGRGSSNWGL